MGESETEQKEALSKRNSKKNNLLSGSQSTQIHYGRTSHELKNTRH